MLALCLSVQELSFYPRTGVNLLLSDEDINVLFYSSPFYELVRINYILQSWALAGSWPLITEVEWLNGGIEGGWLNRGLGLVVVNVAGQFIHLHCISLCCRFGVSALLPENHHMVTCTKNWIWGRNGSAGLVREDPLKWEAHVSPNRDWWTRCDTETQPLNRH